MKLFATLLTLCFFLADPTFGADKRKGGVIVLADECPMPAVEGLSAIFSPIIKAGIGVAVERLGAKLKSISEEKKVETLHGGGHLYKYQEEDGFTINAWCVIIASRVATNDKKTSLASLTNGYQTANVIEQQHQRRLVNLASSNRPLINQLTGLGYADDHKPGILAVFDVELSNARSEFRFVPRFVATDHSLREKKSDSRARDFTYEIALTLPGVEKPFGSATLKFEKMKVGDPYVGYGVGSGIASNWISLPDVGTKEKELATARTQVKTSEKNNMESANLSGSAYRKISRKELASYIDVAQPCGVYDEQDSEITTKLSAAAAAFYEKFIDAKGELADLATKVSKTNSLKTELAIANNLATYHSSCRNVLKSRLALLKTELKDGFLARSFDISVDIKEFRKRPVAEFFADVLSGEDTQGALTTAITEELDPAARKAAAESAAAERQAGLEALETASIAAEIAIIAHQKADEAARALAYLSMESAKRAANRRAVAIGEDQPYPESGLWL